MLLRRLAMAPSLFTIRLEWQNRTTSFAVVTIWIRSTVLSGDIYQWFGPRAIPCSVVPLVVEAVERG